MLYSTDRSKAVVPVLLLCSLFYEAICFMSYLVLFYLVFFSPLSVAINSLGKERANLSAFRTFVRFALVWFCLFPLPLGVWEGLQFVIVALPGFFSLLFFQFLMVKFSIYLNRCVFVMSSKLEKTFGNAVC